MAAAAEETLLLDKIAKLSTRLSKYVARLKELRSPEKEASESEDELVAAVGAISITAAPVGSPIAALGVTAAAPVVATPVAATPVRAAGGSIISPATLGTPATGELEDETEAVPVGPMFSGAAQKPFEARVNQVLKDAGLNGDWGRFKYPGAHLKFISHLNYAAGAGFDITSDSSIISFYGQWKGPTAADRANLAAKAAAKAAANAAKAAAAAKA